MAGKERFGVDRGLRERSYWLVFLGHDDIHSRSSMRDILRPRGEPHQRIQYNRLTRIFRIGNGAGSVRENPLMSPAMPALMRVLCLNRDAGRDRIFFDLPQKMQRYALCFRTY